MERVALFLGAISPALAILAFIVLKARADWRSEPLWNAFFMGAVACAGLLVTEALILASLGWAVALAYSTFGPGPMAAAKAFFAAAIPEEAVKFVILIYVAERHVDVRRKQDILMLSVAVSLGFAALENVAYVAQAENALGMAALRSLTAVPAHGADGLIMGAMVTFARLAPLGRRHLVAALAAPILAHAAYDWPLMAKEATSGIWLFFVWMAVMALIGLLAVTVANRALTHAAAADHAIGLDSPSAPAYVVILAGAAIMMSGGPIAALIVYAAQLPSLAIWGAILTSVLPMIFGGDLLWGYWRNRSTAVIRHA